MARTRRVLIIRSGSGLDATFGLAPVLFTGLGALILSRQPGNRIPWISFWSARDASSNLPLSPDVRMARRYQ